MKKLDLFSRRILSVSIGVTMVILSICLLIVSLKSIAPAHAGNIKKEWVDTKEYQKMYSVIKSDTIVNAEETGDPIIAVQVFGIGIREGNLYFGILYNNNSIGLHKAPAEGEDVLDW